MDKKMLQKTFREFKEATKSAGVGIDFALTNDNGDYLVAKYGADATGIWTSDVEETDEVVYVNHDITTEQVDIFYSVFGEHYNIIPERADYSVGWALQLFEKDTPVWAIYRCGADKFTPHNVTASKTYALRSVDELGTVVQRIF